jgi:phytanoyl-CoA hydroxylase
VIPIPHKQHFDKNGYVLAPQLFTAEEANFYCEHSMRLREHTPKNVTGSNADEQDPLKRYPRLTGLHRSDEVSLRWMLDPRIKAYLVGLLGHEPYAVSTMLYFKPPQARGQALHQDNYYLRVQPGTCLAAWMALDPCDEANGCLQIVPGSHTWPILCTQPADTTQSFTDVTVPIPAGCEIRPMRMQPGDVLFFNGSLVHGSYPNTTTDRFRRSMISHYIEGNAQQVYKWYHPLLRLDGTPVEIGYSPEGSQCGVWVTEQGTPVIELNGFETMRVKETD